MNYPTDITQDQITEQLQLERSQISQGLKRLRDQTFKLEQQNYSSASIYGISSIDTLLPHVVKRIEDTNTKIHQGKYGAAFKDIHEYLSTIEALAAAAIACKLHLIMYLVTRKVATKLQIYVVPLANQSRMSAR